MLHLAHERECGSRIDARLNESSMVLYLLRTFVLNFRRGELSDLSAAERTKASELASRDQRRAEAEADALAG